MGIESGRARGTVDPQDWRETRVGADTFLATRNRDNVLALIFRVKDYSTVNLASDRRLLELRASWP
jgi:hypothetical protein